MDRARTPGNPVPRLRAVASFLALLLGVVAPAGSAEAATGSRGVVVAVGDSFVSGEAARWLGNSRGGGASANGTDRMCVERWWGCELRPSEVYRPGPTFGCHRARSAPVEIVAVDFSRRVNLACSGATTGDISESPASGPASGLPSQSDRLETVASRERVTTVLFTAGANDLGFSEIVARCAEAWISYRPDGCRRLGQITLEERMPSVRRGIASSMDEVISSMARAGYPRQDWDLVVSGYAAPLPPGSRYRYPEGSPRRLLPGGCPFTGADSDWAGGVVASELNAALSRAAMERGGRFLDLSSAFDGHRVCETGSNQVGDAGPSARTAEWFRFLVPCCGGEKRESLHPNAYGQRAIAKCLALFLAERSKSRRCSARSGNGFEGLHLASVSP